MNIVLRTDGDMESVFPDNSFGGAADLDAERGILMRGPVRDAEGRLIPTAETYIYAPE